MVIYMYVTLRKTEFRYSRDLVFIANIIHDHDIICCQMFTVHLITLCTRAFDNNNKRNDSLDMSSVK